MILVTGGTGFLGQYLVRELLEAGYEVRLLVRNPEGRSFPWQNMVEMVEGNILEPLSLEKALEGVTHVIHAAAAVSFWRKKADEVMAVNAEGTAHLVNACLEAGIEKFIHVSSVSAVGKYPDKEQKLIDEQAPWNPTYSKSVYSRSKHRAELEVYRGVAEGMQAAIVNPGFIMGTSPDWNNGTAKIFTIVDKGLRFYNKGISGYVGAADVARACRLLLESDVVDGERFILVAENRSFKEIFGWIANALGKQAPKYAVHRQVALMIGRISELISRINGKEPIISLESMRSGVRSYFFDGNKITRLGFKYTPIEDVIKETASQYLKDHNR